MTSDLYFLYPRLPQHIAETMAEHLVKQTAADLADEWGITHAAVTFAPTGGNRITGELLQHLRTAVLAIAGQYGYPDPPGKNSARSFDIECAVLLHEKLRLHPSEASHNEVWSFLGCVLLPDVVRWRFNDSTDSMRFVGKERGMRRHAFGRLWWRAYLAHNPLWKEPYAILRSLNEDDLVQVTERSSIAVRPFLFQSFCASFATATKTYANLPRRELMREASKRMYRLLSLTSVEALNNHELRHLTDEVFAKTAEVLSSLAQIQT